MRAFLVVALLASHAAAETEGKRVTAMVNGLPELGKIARGR